MCDEVNCEYGRVVEQTELKIWLRIKNGGTIVSFGLLDLLLVVTQTYSLLGSPPQNEHHKEHEIHADLQCV